MAKYAVDIEWDVDEPDELSILPKKVKLPDGIPDDDVADALSCGYFFCVKGFRIVEG